MGGADEIGEGEREGTLFQISLPSPPLAKLHFLSFSSPFPSPSSKSSV